MKKMAEYNPKKIESKWQKEWEKRKVFQATSPSSRAKLATGRLERKKFYALIEFPYPSGDGLHVGHPRPYIGMDIISRKRRLQGFNVLYPIGWDAFGLPTENYAIKTGRPPAEITKKNTDTFRRQIKSLGISFDWSREINTTDPKYYKWTQWIFLQFFKKGLAYKAKKAINWCPKDKTGLADEEVIGGCCERCGTPVEKREKEQWMLAITKYADRLDKDLDDVDYLPQIKLGQRNWIGRSEGAEIEFKIIHPSPTLPEGEGLGGVELGTATVFTTRPDTIFGATYLVLSPEHELVQKLKSQIKNFSEVEKYIKEVKNKTDIERTAEDKVKTGVELKGIKAINPANKEEIPIWIADYVLATYGTGAIMAVPAHDERDFEFAKKYNLEIKQVIQPIFGIENKRKDVVHRNTITGIVKSSDGKKILMLKWKDYDWLSGVIGGIEGDESPEKAAEREVLEETGYKTKAVFVSPIKIESHFFAEHKNEWRSRIDTPVVLNLVDEKPEIISDKERAKHEVRWVDMKEVFTSTMFGNNKLAIELALSRSAYTGFHGYQKDSLINSGRFDGMYFEKAKKEIIKFVGGKEKTVFKLRDWIFSRQRYWGEPIPVIFCENCELRGSASKTKRQNLSVTVNSGWIPVPEKDLPVELPKVKNYQPTDSGESPLANISKWVNTKCPKCKGKAKRETDTMPNWAGSSWYYLRYTDPKNKKEFASQKNLKYWLTPSKPPPKEEALNSSLSFGEGKGGVDWYNGGNEHTTLHLLYSRFWHKFLFDLKLAPTSEPYMKRTSHGMILGEGGVKMSKSLGNVINPDDIVKTYGADTLRVYEMFMGPFNQSVAWSTESIIGARRFIEKVWRIGMKVKPLPLDKGEVGWGYTSKDPSLVLPLLRGGGILTRLLHKTIKKVSEDIEEMHFNTAISSMMILATEMEKAESVQIEDYKKFLQILSPFAPHVTEELWGMLGEKKLINFSDWPKVDKNLIQDEEVKIAVQINGKVRAEIVIKADSEEEKIKNQATSNEIVLRHLAGKDIKKVIYVKNRLINIVA